MPDFLSLTNALLLVHWTFVVVVSIRVIMRRRPIGVSLAWLALLFLLPFVGTGLYLLVGETRLGDQRTRRALALREAGQSLVGAMRERAAKRPIELPAHLRPIERQATATIGLPAVGGNRLRLYDDAIAAFRQLVRDIDGAERTVHLLFYIVSDCGVVNDVFDALSRATERGVSCRLLVDAIGSKDFLNSPAADSLRRGGVRVVAALPVGPVRSLFVRIDVRNHRKIAVIDGHTAYTGSLNLCDPKLYMQDEPFGEWVDTMVRLEGPAAEALELTFLNDWQMEGTESIESLMPTGDLREVEPKGSTPVQVVPSGPGQAPKAIHEMLLTAIYAARTSIVITTPYFVPDESLMTAIRCAARRGVSVHLVVPARSDSRLVHIASRANFDDLLEDGVRVFEYTSGLLHAKTITVDDQISLIGTANMDMRSFWLNLEITLFVYDETFTADLRALQDRYAADAREFDGARWAKRPVWRRFVENTVRLLGPLL
ncbi:MAG: cardiolipin synthase [Phycisphaerales bacterium]|nr:cardiolipin synthase [Phycisphaerales bacterium]